MRRTLALTLAAGLAALGLAAAGMAGAQLGPSVHLPADKVLTPPQLLAAPLPATASEQVKRGHYLTIVGDCVACHTPYGGRAFSGGRGIVTPFGTIYTPNLTGDKDTGMGGWSGDQFWNAMHAGRDDVGKHLYPAFPYVYFNKVTRADSDAILAYLKTTPPVHNPAPRNGLPFPLNIRAAVMGWNLLFFHPTGALADDPAQPAEWNRGRYLVEGLGHCQACHTPKNPLGGDHAGRPWQGYILDNWYAPNLTGERRVGLGRWSAGDVAEYLKTGRNAYAQAAGPMAEVVSDSTSMMSDADLRAMAVYLKSRAPSPAPARVATADRRAMNAGRAVYVDACTGCHRTGGQGEARFFPPLGGSPDVQSAEPVNTIRVILDGARTAPSPTRPSPLSMPSFAWKLSDRQIADVATYVRQSWGNRAAPVDPHEVALLRGKLKLASSRPSSWSGR